MDNHNDGFRQTVSSKTWPTLIGPDPFSKSELITFLRGHLLKSDELLALGFPVRIESEVYFFINKLFWKTLEKSKINVPKLGFDPASFTNGDESAINNTRPCDRCKKIFQITKRNFEMPDTCIYHWGRPQGLFGKRRHSCCQALEGEKGCSLGQYHVHRGPMPGYNGPLDGYVETTSSRGGIFGLDAEMIYTAAGMEVARVVIIDAYGSPIYDTLVKPSARVLDCNTVFSGINPEDVSAAVKSLEDVQSDILDLIGHDSILVGHALENDLRVLKIIHRAVADTSVLYPDKRGFPYKRSLRHLTKEFLGRDIQQDPKGHDPVEDARAALQLAYHAREKYHAKGK